MQTAPQQRGTSALDHVRATFMAISAGRAHRRLIWDCLEEIVVPQVETQDGALDGIKDALQVARVCCHGEMRIPDEGDVRGPGDGGSQQQRTASFCCREDVGGRGALLVQQIGQYD